MPGLLLARGPGVFSGYWRDDAATAAAFHGNWFNTGAFATFRSTSLVRSVDERTHTHICSGSHHACSRPAFCFSPAQLLPLQLDLVGFVAR